MILKWFGAALIISGCTLVGFSISAACRREEWELRQLVSALEYMACELKYRRSPLPELCRIAGSERKGCVATILTNLAAELESHASADVQSCLAIAAATTEFIPRRLKDAICVLGSSLGRYDLEGQLLGLESVRHYCREQLDEMAHGREARLRSYQTLGLCTGAALAILFV